MPTHIRFPRLAAFAALLLAAAGCTDGPVATNSLVPAPIALLVVSGDGQSALANTELPAPLVVQVTDAKGHAVRDQIVNFRVVQGGGSVYAGSSLTNKDGLAKEWWTLGSSGPQGIEVRAVDPTTGEKKLFATFNATITEPPPPPVSKDAFEPNDFQGSREIGTVSNGQSFTLLGNFHTPTDVDWYRLRTVEGGAGSCFPGNLQNFKLRVELSAPGDFGHGYQLSIYDGPTLIQQIAVAGGSLSYDYNYTGTCGVDDGKTIDIKVERFSGDFVDSRYEVTVQYTEF